MGRKYSWAEVSRSTISMLPEQTGQRSSGLVGGCDGTATPSSERQSARVALQAAIVVIAPSERHIAVAKIHESVVGDGDAVGIASQIVQDLVWSAEGRLGIDDPVVYEQLINEPAECSRAYDLSQ